MRMVWTIIGLGLTSMAMLTGCGGTADKAKEVPVAGQPYHHAPDGGFRNIPGSPERYATTWDFQKFFWGNIFRSKAVDVPSGHALTPAQAAASWDATTGDKLQWLGHSAFRWQLGATTLLSDPLLTDRASPFSFVGPKRFVPSPLAPEAARADVILLTHNHYDHLDVNTLKRLPNRDTVQVVVPLGVGDVVREAGIAHVTELDWHQSTRIGDVDITLAPAVHFSARWLNDRNRTLWGGFVLRQSGKAYYLSGDTTMNPTLFKDIGQQYGPFDYALVSIGAYEPRSIMIGSHMNPEEAVLAGEQLRGRTLVGHHWGAIRLTTEPAFEPPVRFANAARQAGFADDHIWVMKVGETRALTKQP